MSDSAVRYLLPCLKAAGILNLKVGLGDYRGISLEVNLDSISESFISLFLGSWRLKKQISIIALNFLYFLDCFPEKCNDYFLLNMDFA